MITKGNFLLLELPEFRPWILKQHITRGISRLQVHHTWLPNYSTRKGQDHFKCLEGMRNSHLANGWSGTGQNITIFEDGKVAISLDRDLNKVPAGIAGANTGAICVEIIGDFDKGRDDMTSLQREAVGHVYACLASKLKIPVDTDHIVYHAWYTPSGSFLGDYVPNISSKTCPGTNFWGMGNTVASAKKGFLQDVQYEYDKLKESGDDAMTTVEKLEFDNLVKKVAKLEEETKKIPAPKWFVSEFGSSDLGGKISDPSFTLEGWRTLAVGLRVGK
ncbi:peptidoglycan recognition family protein [Paenibacillus lutimineralis]|uniref:N-acetylmuramoyl-L-alanine amidase n=1 Tax=Paenibacillus lutimineralis TaxID=2707005 RepID=A0A3Q9IBU3_9BACL|nr:peptidoglycan recognition family protein [Paenibacillus lutimineralis]AZS17379.1 N-acetylmuramoyl-L-alanine amidase [Paenibacillus lutimineralis]